MIADDGREPTPEELDAMASYIGWGSFGQELFQGTWGYKRPKPGWEDEDAWLRDHLGKDAWESAQNSIINAHYTDPPTVQAIWKMVERLGFKGGRVLEPSMGVGNFFGMMPVHLEAASELTGIELDQTTGGIAKLLYPRANVRIMGYEKSRTPDDFYDLVIGNWPFANFSLSDRRYNRLNPSLHDYFFLKALDQVRPGGLVVGITSAFTMDGQKNKAIRLELAKKADLIDAFRLPSGAFEKYAGTSVVTDIIILRKREVVNPEAASANWVGTSEVDTPAGTPVRVNHLFATYPQNVLGTINFGSGSTYGKPSMIVDRPADLMDRLEGLPDRLPEGVYEPRRRKNEPRYIANSTEDRTFAVTIGEDGALYHVRGDQMAPLGEVIKIKTGSAEETAGREAQIRALVDLRKKTGAVIDADRAGAADAEAKRKTLADAYRAFAKAHGPIGDSFGIQALTKARDPFVGMLRALETVDGKPASIMDRPVVRSDRKVDQPTIRDAFVIARNEAVRLDIDRIAELAKASREDVISDLTGSKAIYRTPGGGYEAADAYLAGNVRVKLREAREALDRGEDMQGSIDALVDAQPEDVPYYNIEARFGADWIPAPISEQFIRETLALPAGDDGVRLTRAATGWRVDVPDRVARMSGIPDITGASLPGRKGTGLSLKRFLEAALNTQTITVTDEDDEGGTYRNTKETDAANQKAEELRAKFGDWIWSDVERRVEMERDYNEIMNAVATPQVDGAFLDFPGMAVQRGASPLSLRKHQEDAIWRGILNQRGIYGHEVGTGKTITMTGIAVESRRYGLARKPLLIAHNANSAAVAREAQETYPGAKVMYVNNLSPDQIDAQLNRMMTEDWDLIVIPHSLIDRMALTEETLMRMAADDIAAYEAEAIAAAEEEGITMTEADFDDAEFIRKKLTRAPTAKEMVKARNRIIEQIRKQAERSSRDGAVSFERLGIDMILVDESHEFKKPPLATRMQVKGLNKGTSNRSLALRFLTSYVKSMRGGTGVHVFTGTPITNTLAEIYHQMYYVMDDVMRQNHVDTWDGFFKTFANTIADVEVTSTNEYENVERLAAFINVSELRRMAGQFLDIVFADEMPEFTPRQTISGKTAKSEGLTDAEREELLNGRHDERKGEVQGRPYKKVIHDIGPMSYSQRAILSQVVDYAAAFKSASGKERREIMQRGGPDSPIVFNAVPNRASMDARLHDIEAPDDPESKANRAVRNIARIYRDEPEATQVLFMDEGFSDEATRTRTNEDGSKTTVKVAKFNLVNDIIENLVDAGVKRAEIAVVAGGVTAEQKRAVADKMNRGEVRVVIGQTKTLGVGVNMQRNLRAMHHLDAPWMPGDLEQRNGRGQRQGNLWNTVLEYRYLTEGLDGRRWQVLAIKDRFIKAFLKAKDGLRVIEGDAADDADSMDGNSLADTLSEAAGDPRLMQINKLKKRIERLQRRERTFSQGVADAVAKAKGLRRELDRRKERLAPLRDDARHVAAIREAGTFAATVEGKTFTERPEAAEAIDAYLGKAVQTQPRGETRLLPIEVNGFAVKLDRPRWGDNGFLSIARKGEQGFGKPSLASIEAAIRRVPNDLADSEVRISEIEAQASRLEGQSTQTFQQADDLAKMVAQRDAIEIDMKANPVPAPSWLRTGAPLDTLIYVGGQERIVTGHRWTAENWFVSTAEGDVAYTEAGDESGVAIFDERPFEAPVVSEGSKMKTGEESPEEGDMERRAFDAAAPEADPEALATDINRELRRHGIAGRVTVSLVRGLIGERGGVIAGRYRNGEIALNPESGDVLGTLRHEIVHALRKVFSPGEWQALVRAAKRDATIKAMVLKAYKDKGRDAQEEEMVAELYRKWAAEGIAMGGIKRLMQRIARFVEAVGNALRGNGFIAAADVMERVSRGEVGGRLGDTSGSRLAAEMRQAMPGLIRPTRAAATLDEARAAATEFRGQPLTNRATGIIAVVSRNTLDKMLSVSAVHKSATPSLHSLAVANLDALFEGALFGWSKPDKKGDPNIAAILRFFVPFTFERRALIAKMTVKETAQADRQNPLYTVEAVDFDEAPSAAIWVGEIAEAEGVDPRTTRSAEDIVNMARWVDDFNGNAPGSEMRLDLISAASRAKGMIGNRQWRADKAFFSDFINDAMAGNIGPSALSLVPGRALFAELGKRLHSARTYLRGKEEMDALRNEWHSRADTVAQDWLTLRRKDKGTNDRFMDLMHRTTLAGVDPSEDDRWSHPFEKAAREAISRLGETNPAASWARDVMDIVSRRRASYTGLKAEFEALPEAFRDLYKRLIAEYAKMGDDFEAAVFENMKNAQRIAVKRAERAHRKEIRRIEDEGMEGAERDIAKAEADAALDRARQRGGWAVNARIALLRKSFESNRLKGPYFPLARFGKFFVTIRDADGTVVSFSRFDKARDQRRFAEEAERGNPGRVQKGIIGEGAKLSDQVDPGFVADVQALLGDAGADPKVMDAVWQRWLETLPDQSIRTSRIHRKGTRGYSGDAYRAFGHHMFHGAHQLARLKYGLALEEALNDAEEEAARAEDPVRSGLVVDEMRKRHEFAMNPAGGPLAASMSSLAFVWYLAATPGAALANLTQTTVVGIPLLAAKFRAMGISGVSRALGKATKDFAASRGKMEDSDRLSPNEKMALMEAIRRGTIDRTQAHDLAGVAETGIEYSGARELVMRKLSFLFHHAERFNREVTFVAAYRLAVADGQTHEDAIETAADMTWKIHFSYQNTDRPRIMQNDLMKVLTTFRQFTVNMLWRLFRDAHQSFKGATQEERAEARTQLIGMTLSMMAHAGIRGTWGFGILMGLLGVFFPGGGDDIEDWLQDALLMEGDDLGTAAWNYMMGAALNGAPGQVLGLDLRERIGMPHLWFRPPSRDLEGEDLYAHWVGEVGGPVLGIGDDVDAPAPPAALWCRTGYRCNKRSVDDDDHDDWTGFGEERVPGAWR